MMDDPKFLEAKARYLDTLRAIGQQERKMGLAASIVGLLTLAYAMTQGGGFESPFGLAGISATAAGWTLFVHAGIKRARFVRANPFRSNV